MTESLAELKQIHTEMKAADAAVDATLAEYKKDKKHMMELESHINEIWRMIREDYNLYQAYRKEILAMADDHTRRARPARAAWRPFVDEPIEYDGDPIARLVRHKEAVDAMNAIDRELTAEKIEFVCKIAGTKKEDFRHHLGYIYQVPGWDSTVPGLTKKLF
jgi:hypothetical protein